jgi:hydrogenase maturation protease
MMKTLVLGIGNLLLSDEGVGVHVARALQRENLHGAEVLEIGTAFLDALPALEHADRIIVVDAMQAEGAPGTVYRIPFEDCARRQSLASLHDFDLSRALFLAGRQSYPSVTVIGIEPAKIAWGTELSAEVARMLPEAVAAVRAEIALSPLVRAEHAQ